MFAPGDQAIFALVNDSDKRVYVSYSSRLHQRVGTILSEILAGDWKYKQMVLDRDKLAFVILEQQDTKNYVKYFIDQYRKQGYYIYNGTEKIPLEYRFRIEFDNRNILVCAVNKRNESITLGTFSMYDAANEFLQYVSSNNPAKSLVFAI